MIIMTSNIYKGNNFSIYNNTSRLISDYADNAYIISNLRIWN